jgi:hypothetical protein
MHHKQQVSYTDAINAFKDAPHRQIAPGETSLTTA